MDAIVDTPKEAVGGRLPENVLYFARTLRDAGLRVGPSSVVDAVEAVKQAGLGDRDDLYWTLHCVFVTRKEDHPVFHQAFQLFWRSRDLVEKMIAMFSPMADPRTDEKKPEAAQSRVSEALFQGAPEREMQERPELDIDASFSMSEKEVLNKKDFAQMTAAEFAQARLEIEKLRLPVDTVTTRRFRTAPTGG